MKVCELHIEYITTLCSHELCIPFSRKYFHNHVDMFNSQDMIIFKMKSLPSAMDNFICVVLVLLFTDLVVNGQMDKIKQADHGMLPTCILSLERPNIEGFVMRHIGSTFHLVFIHSQLLSQFQKRTSQVSACTVLDKVFPLSRSTVDSKKL